MSTKTRNAVAAARSGQDANRIVMGIGGAVIVALVVAIAVAVITASRSTGGPIVAPAAATADGAIRVGSGGTTVAVYLDYMCPYCGRFERANSTDLGDLVAAGDITLELHPMSFLDRASNGAGYSTRAANAIVTVADRDAAHLLAFNSALFENQPAEGTTGLDDARIAALAAGAGVPESVISTFADRTFVPWIEQATQTAFDDGVTGTPTVKINGVKTDADLYTAGSLRAAL
ncbi:DsbA family protein [Actinoplanes subglobosus]|uniref:DsbA family protein n=1 Tax=Actinoplanes subglobosus TaxID=1547892 RepID=A0ABV8IWW4_9ACTN